MTPRTLPTTAFAVFCALMLGLAAGACWMVVTLYLRRPTPWLALPVGLLLGWTIRAWVLRGGRVAAILAVLASLLAATYVSMLLVGAMIAGNMGMGLIASLRTAGIGMLLELAQINLSRADMGWFAAGAALAAFVASRRSR